MTIRRGSVHITCVNNVEDENFWLIPAQTKSTQLSVAIKNGVQEYVRQWNEELQAWLVTYEGPDDEMLVNAIPERAFCLDCIDWLDKETEEPCGFWVDNAELLQEDFNLIIFRPGEEPKESLDIMSFVTRIAEGVKKVAGPELSELTAFARGRARKMVARNLSTMFGIEVDEELIDQVFDAIWAQRTRPASERMTPPQAATLLGCRWPCSKDEVIVAFRKRAHETHPDKGGSPEAFIQVNLAKEVLLDAL